MGKTFLFILFLCPFSAHWSMASTYFPVRCLGHIASGGPAELPAFARYTDAVRDRVLQNTAAFQLSAGDGTLDETLSLPALRALFTHYRTAQGQRPEAPVPQLHFHTDPFAHPDYAAIHALFVDRVGLAPQVTTAVPVGREQAVLSFLDEGHPISGVFRVVIGPDNEARLSTLGADGHSFFNHWDAALFGYEAKLRSRFGALSGEAIELGWRRESTGWPLGLGKAPEPKTRTAVEVGCYLTELVDVTARCKVTDVSAVNDRFFGVVATPKGFFNVVPHARGEAVVALPTTFTGTALPPFAPLADVLARGIVRYRHAPWVLTPVRNSRFELLEPTSGAVAHYTVGYDGSGVPWVAEQGDAEAMRWIEARP